MPYQSLGDFIDAANAVGEVRYVDGADLDLDVGCLTLAVDDDIGPTNLEEVLWAMCTRVDPGTAVDVIHDAWTADLDPRVSPARRAAGELTVGRMLINACRPFSWRDRFPESNVFAAADRQKVADKWRDLLENLSEPRAPSTARPRHRP